MEVDSGISQEAKISISGALSKTLADTYVLYLKTQNFHWNVHGPVFYSLHKLSQKQYEEMAEAIDEIAERIRALGFFVDGSMENFLSLSSIPQDQSVHSTQVYLEHLIKAHEKVIRDLRLLGNLADTHHDHATVDLVGRRLGFHEKACWMLRSQI